MNAIALLGRALILCALACLPALGAVPDTALPPTSIFRLHATLVDQDGKPFHLEDRRGQVTLVSMFYNSCEFVCPMLIDTMRQTEGALDEADRARLGMLLITFDPARDSVKVLKDIARQRTLAPPQWTLARTDGASVRKIAATLDIQFRRLENGEYNHTTMLVLLDGEGRVLGNTRKIGAVDPDFLALIHATLAH